MKVLEKQWERGGKGNYFVLLFVLPSGIELHSININCVEILKYFQELWHLKLNPYTSHRPMTENYVSNLNFHQRSHFWDQFYENFMYMKKMKSWTVSGIMFLIRLNHNCKPLERMRRSPLTSRDCRTAVQFPNPQGAQTRPFKPAESEPAQVSGTKLGKANRLTCLWGLFS